MLSKCGTLLAAVVLAAFAATAAAQDPNPNPPQPPPQQQQQPAPQPQQAPPPPQQPAPAPDAVQPQTAPPANPPALEPQTPPPDVPATTVDTEKHVTKSKAKATKNTVKSNKKATTKKIETKKEDSSALQPSTSNDKAAAAAGTSAIDTTGGNTGANPPTGTTSDMQPAAPAAGADVPNTAPPNPVRAEDSTEAPVPHHWSAMSWLLGLVVLAGLIGVGAMTIRRRREERLSIYDRGRLASTTMPHPRHS